MAQGSREIATDPLRAFDFWVGRWVVTDPNSGEVLGRNRIERIVGGRALHEHWLGVSGLEGESLNMYDEASGRWHQTWVSQNGMLLRLDGGIEGGSMQMQGGDPIQRIRWTPHADGTVLQQWDESVDGGTTWAMLFEGLYRREPADA